MLQLSIAVLPPVRIESLEVTEANLDEVIAMLAEDGYTVHDIRRAGPATSAAPARRVTYEHERRNYKQQLLFDSGHSERQSIRRQDGDQGPWRSVTSAVVESWPRATNVFRPNDGQPETVTFALGSEGLYSRLLP